MLRKARSKALPLSFSRLAVDMADILDISVPPMLIPDISVPPMLIPDMFVPGMLVPVAAGLFMSMPGMVFCAEALPMKMAEVRIKTFREVYLVGFILSDRLDASCKDRVKI